MSQDTVNLPKREKETKRKEGRKEKVTFKELQELKQEVKLSLNMPSDSIHAKIFYLHICILSNTHYSIIQNSSLSTTLTLKFFHS